MLKRLQRKVLEISVADLSRVMYKGEAGSPNVVYFSMEEIKRVNVGSMSQSYVLDKVAEIERDGFRPAVVEAKRVVSLNKCKNVNGKKAVLRTNNMANVANLTSRAMRKYDTNRTTIERNRVLETLVSFKFTAKDLEDADNLSMVLTVLEHGATCIENGIVFGRTFRSPSHFRAGGAWLSMFPEQYRNIFSFGKENNMTTEFETVASKWESQLALSLTNSLPVNMGRNLNICVIEDITREVAVNAHMVEGDGEAGINETEYDCFKGFDVVKTGDDKNDFRFKISAGRKTVKLELPDGFALMTPEVAETIRKYTMKGASDKALAYLCAVQFRMPFMKGMTVEFDIQGYCKETGIHTIVDVYGKAWNVEDIDMLVPESVFKGVGLFNSIDEYTDRCLDGEFEFTTTVGDITVSNTFKYFNNYDYFRIVNHNQEKDEYNEMTYQYLQSLTMLENEVGVDFTKTIFDYARNCTTDINSARALCGMLGTDQEDFNSSMVSKLTYILDLKPSLFQERFVQKRLLKLIDKLVQDQAVGRVMVQGAYHFIISDPTLHFTGAVDGVLQGKDRPTLSSTDEAGIIPKGYTYQAGEEHDSVAALFRSPLVYESESAVVTFGRSEVMDKWLGHLKGLIIFNGYEAIAMGMGGADYDGDKAYKTKDKRIIAGIRREKDGSALPLVISPMEKVKAHKQCISKAVLFDLDERTLDNQTGLITNMGTFYQNQLIHIKRVFRIFFAGYRTATPQESYEYYRSLFPATGYDYNTYVANMDAIVAEARTTAIQLVETLDYKLKVVRFASASEIDFVKHGVRMPLPNEVATTGRLEWLASNKARRKGTSLIKDYHRLEMVEYRQPCYVWYKKNKATGELEQRRVAYVLDTPMQRISTFTKEEWSNIQTAQMQNANKGNMITALLGDANMAMPVNAMAILEEVRAMRESFCQATSQFGRNVNGLESEELAKKFKAIYTDYTERCMKFLDRKAFALACVYLSQEMDSDDNFALVCAFDGIVELLVEQAQTSVRSIKVEVPRFVSHVTVADGVGTYEVIENGVPVTHTLELPEIEFADGHYPIADSINARYMSFNKILTAEDKESVIKYAYNTASDNGVTKSVNLRSSVNYDMVISGFKFKHNSLTGQAHTAETVYQAIVNAGCKARVVKEEFANGDVRPSLEVNGEIVATIKALDAFRIKENGTINFNGMEGRILNLNMSKAQPFVTKKGCDVLTLANSLTVSCMVENMIPVNIKLAPEYANCNLNKWYFSTGIIESEQRFETLSDWGYEWKIDLMEKAVPGQRLAMLYLLKDGIMTTVEIGYISKEVGLAVGTVIKGEQVLDANKPAYREIIACCYRTVSMEFAKMHYVAPTCEIPGAEEFRATRTALLLTRKKAMVNSAIKMVDQQDARAEERRMRNIAFGDRVQRRENVDSRQKFWCELVNATKKKGLFNTLTSIENGEVVMTKEPAIYAYWSMAN